MIGSDVSDKLTFIKGVENFPAREGLFESSQSGEPFVGLSPVLAAPAENSSSRLLRVKELGLTKPHTQKVSTKFNFPEKLGILIVDGLVNGVPLSSYSKPLQRAVSALTKLGEYEYQSNTDTQLAIALDEFLGGINNE